MKLIIAGAIAALSLGAPASAEIIGPAEADAAGNFYVYTEVESDWALGEYEGTSTTARVGYEGDLSETVGAYIEVGPSFINPDGEDLTTELGFEVGAEVAVTENLTAYAEVELFTNGGSDLGEDLDIGTKAGLTYSF
jgi:hypothetical protein